MCSSKGPASRLSFFFFCETAQSQAASSAISPSQLLLLLLLVVVIRFPLYVYVFDDIAWNTWFLVHRFEVDHVCNLTDVDDKIIARMARDGNTLKDLTEKYAALFFDDLQSLNIIPASRYPRATEHIDDIVEMIQVRTAHKSHCGAPEGKAALFSYFCCCKLMLSLRALPACRAGVWLPACQRVEFVFGWSGGKGVGQSSWLTKRIKGIPLGHRPGQRRLYSSPIASS